MAATCRTDSTGYRPGHLAEPQRHAQKRPLMFDMQVIVRLLEEARSASITLHIWHYAARQGEGDRRSPA
jgi:hypothetical protein